MASESKHNCENCISKAKGIFCHLEHEELSEVNNHKVVNIYKKGQVIFHQGNPPFGLYCIATGKIKVTKVGNDGKESIVRLATGGDVLGHRSLFSSENYSASATALEDTTICFLDKKFIIKAIQDQPSIALNIIQKMSREMGMAEAKSAAMFQKNVRERLAELLLSLGKTYGVKEAQGLKINIKLTREEIASMIGTASETVIRTISEFKDEGIIKQDGKIIYLLDEEALLDVANISF